MSWNVEQWDGFCALLDGWWPGDFSDDSAVAWRVALEPVEPRVAIAALTALFHAGRTFRPSASELVAEIRRDPSKPTFDEAYHWIYRAAAAQEIRSDAHPLVRSFVERQGLQRLGRLPLDDPEWGEKHRRDLEAAWDRHCEAFDGREIAALASGSGNLRQLDPMASLQLGSGDAAR